VIVNWQAFKESAPELASKAEELFEEKIGWAPKEPKFHVFESVDIKSAAAYFVNEAQSRKVERFRAGDGIDALTQTV